MARLSILVSNCYFGRVVFVAEFNPLILKNFLVKHASRSAAARASAAPASCLSIDYNQKIHDILNREYAADFLKKYDDAIEATESHEKDGASS